MAGIYIHIPFCKQACYYCNFHFSTSLRFKSELITALIKEIELQKNYCDGEIIDTIYFGGGTPSLCTTVELQNIVEAIQNHFTVASNTEITFEANPDDITEANLISWKTIGINRLSIGIQSFFEDDLQWMNRAHTSQQAIESLNLATKYFDNISADLIYGTPLLTNKKWEENVNRMMELNIRHLSCYALTVELKTPLQKMILENKKENVDPEIQATQFLLLMQWLGKAGYEHYEISNFAKPGFRSKHNASYWQQKKYLGIGPAAHSFNGKERQWNISNNNLYIETINKEQLTFQKEVLTEVQKLNENIMTSLRTIEGLNVENLDAKYKMELQQRSKKYIETGKITMQNNHLILTVNGKLFADGIAADLFFSEKI